MTSLQRRNFGWPAFAVLLTLTIGVAHGDESTPTITVTGSAEVRVVPDQVTLRIGVESRAKQLSEAADDNGAKVAEVVDFLRSENVPEQNVRTESLRIRPIYQRAARAKAQQQVDDPFAANPPPAKEPGQDAELTASGYVVERQLSITCNQVERFEEIYRGLIEHGVNQVESIAFNTTQLRQHRQQARTAAIRAAKEKAESLAGELGAQLAGVQSITEAGTGGRGRSQNPFAGDPFGMPAERDSSIAAGEIEVTAAVHVIFGLKATEFE